MAEPQPQFWFPQISGNTSDLHSLAVVKAVNQVLVLFSNESGYIYQIPICDEGASLSILSSSSFCTKNILQFFDKGVKPPFYILGTVPHNEAVAQSRKDFVLNLFELPLGRWPKIFRYIPILSLPDMLKAVSDEISNYNNAIEYAKQHTRCALQWAQCYKWIEEIQTCFGHGNRDRMQFYGIRNATERIQHAKNAVPKELPCLECHVKNALENAYYHIPTESEFQQLLRRVANIDCQSCRLAPLSSIPSNMKSRYKRVVILEDDPDMRKHLAKKIGERYGIDSVQKADVDKFINNWILCDKKGKEIKLKDENCDEWDTLVCFDLELGQRERTHGMPCGLWLLYHVALHYPFVSRLVITGYRTQDEQSFNAGTCGFLLKPFTDRELNVAIDTSSPFRVLGICPDTVRADWEQWASKVNNEASYNWIGNKLAAWLGQYHICLDTIAEYDETTITKYSVIVMDYYSIDPNHDLNRNQADTMNTLNKLVNDYLKIRSSNPSANIIVILPMEDHIFKPFGALHSVGRIIRDGHDTILHKPMWICSDDPKVRSLGQTIKTMLAERPLFDVKYMIYTPIMGLVWPKARNFFERKFISPDKSSGKDLDPFDGWSPLGVLMGDIWGFTASFKDILADSKRLEAELSERLNNERAMPMQRWKVVPDKISSNELVQEFLKYLCQPGNKVASCLSIDRWLRAVLNKHISDEPGKRSLTESLTHLFGGETRYEFGTRGGWYDFDGTFVQDAPLIIEFCGRKGIVARKAIEDVVVDYLKSMGGEQEVLFQEIPIRGFLR